MNIEQLYYQALEQRDEAIAERDAARAWAAAWKTKAKQLRKEWHGAVPLLAAHGYFKRRAE